MGWAGELAVSRDTSILHTNDTNWTTRGKPNAPTQYNYAPKDNPTDINNDTIASPHIMDD
jgi:hypothetical protein